MEKVQLTELGGGYALKYDGYRKDHRWTALSPGHRLGPDVETAFEAMQAILNHWNEHKEDYVPVVELADTNRKE